MALPQNIDWANMSVVNNGPYGSAQLYYNGSGQVNIPAGQWIGNPEGEWIGTGTAGSLLYGNSPTQRRGILWGPERKLDYWAALRAGAVPPAERRAVTLLASIADERRLAYYLHSGLFPAMGNATKRIYMVRRFHTVVELDDGVPVASWCILTKDRHNIPETDHVVAMKNLVEGEEMAFREVGNCFQPNTDPFVGQVPLKSEFPNPYVNGAIGRPRIRNDRDGVRKTHDEQRRLREETELRQDDARQIAQRKAFSRWLVAFSLARKWTPNAPRPEMKQYRPLSEWQRKLLDVGDKIARGFGIPGPSSQMQART